MSQVDLHENSRNSYSDDILHWMALTVFRRWLRMEVAVGQTHHAIDPLSITQRPHFGLAGTFGDAYLKPGDVAQFHARGECPHPRSVRSERMY